MPQLALGEIDTTWATDLSPREHQNIDAIHRYRRHLTNGGTFERPLEILEGTHILGDGRHRFQAYAQFYGDDWAKAKVDVLYVRFPDPREDPAAYSLYLHKANVGHGLPQNEAETTALAEALYRTRGASYLRLVPEALGYSDQTIDQLVNAMATRVNTGGSAVRDRVLHIMAMWGERPTRQDAAQPDAAQPDENSVAFVPPPKSAYVPPTNSGKPTYKTSSPDPTPNIVPGSLKGRPPQFMRLMRPFLLIPDDQMPDPTWLEGWELLLQVKDKVDRAVEAGRKRRSA